MAALRELVEAAVFIQPVKHPFDDVLLVEGGLNNISPIRCVSVSQLTAASRSSRSSGMCTVCVWVLAVARLNGLTYAEATNQFHSLAESARVGR